MGFGDATRGRAKMVTTVRTQGGAFSHFLMHRKDFSFNAAAEAPMLPI